MIYDKFTKIQTSLVVLILMAGIAIRFIHLGDQPLSESEANLALQALSSSKGGVLNWSGEPLYLALTSGLFTIFDQTNFAARFIPALMGSLLVGMPFLFRKMLGNPVSLLLSAFLAIDASMISLSRTSGGATLTIFLIGICLLLLLKKQMIGAAVLFGLALLGGIGIWFMLIPLVLAVIIWKFASQKSNNSQGLSLNILTDSFRDRGFWLAALLSMLVLGTFYLNFPRSLSAFPGSLIAYFQAWQSQSQLTFPQMLLGLLFYFPLGLLFGVWGGVRGLKSINQFGTLLFAWFLVGLLFLLIIPARDLTQIIWVTVPLYLLSAREIMRHISIENEVRFQSLGVSMLVIAIVAFLWLNLGKITYNGDPRQLWLAIGGGIGLLAVSAILIFLGWSGQIAVKGYVWGIIGVLTIYSISTGVRTAGIIGNGQTEMLGAKQTIPQVRLIRNTIKEISTWNAGSSTGLPVKVVGLDSKSMEWELKEFTNINYSLNIEKDEHPELVISGLEQPFALQDQYRGQDFIFQNQIEWASFSAMDWISWLVHRKTLTSNSTIVMWVRADQFPDGQLSFPGQE